MGALLGGIMVGGGGGVGGARGGEFCFVGAWVG